MKNAKTNANLMTKKTYKLMWQEYVQFHLNNILNKCLNNFFLLVTHHFVELK